MFLAFGETSYQPQIEIWFTKIPKKSLHEIVATSEYFEEILDQFANIEGELIQFQEHDMNEDCEVFHACEEWLDDLKHYLDTTILPS